MTEIKQERKIIRPQEGFQEEFLKSSADIVIGGAGAGVGKSYALLLDALYDIDNPLFSYTIFRRNLTQIKNAGALWDESSIIYSGVLPNPTAKVSELKWEFPSGATVKFSHLEYEKDIYSWQGSQLNAIGFDELTHFTMTQFLYLLSRNRSVSGVKPRVRATCNPDPDSWVAKLIDWWIDEDGFPIKERVGVIRYFLMNGSKIEDIIWGNSKKEVLLKSNNIIERLSRAEKINPEDLIKSITFIPGSIYDNKELLKIDPGYLGNLATQDEVTRSQLLEGNWKIKQSGEEMVTADDIYSMVDRPPQSNGRRAITTDVAMKGSDKMVIFVWDGFHLIDFTVVKRSNGRQVVDSINGMMKKWHIQANNIVYDGNNMGSFIDGFIVGAREFLNNGTPLNGEWYANLKSQCADKWAMRLKGIFVGKENNLTYSIDRNVAERIIDGKTLMEHLVDERRAMRLANSSIDGKTALIKKSEMKLILGHSPDFVETMFMLEFLYLGNETYNGYIIW